MNSFSCRGDLSTLSPNDITGFLFISLQVMVVVFSVTFNNISFISWHSVLLVEETGIPGENY
jgi:hypothetical protein